MMECSKSLEVVEYEKENCKRNIPTISTIYDPKNGFGSEMQQPNSMQSKHVPSHTTEGNKKKSFLEHIKKLSSKLSSKDKANSESLHSRFVFFFICFAFTLLLISSTVIFFLNSKKHTGAKEIMVDGEFQILNEPFQYEMLDKYSPLYNQLFSTITNNLDKLFIKSEIAEYYESSELLEVTPEMTIKCLLIFKNSDNVNVGKIGIAFLRSLKLQHGHTWLGNYTINIQSIGFQIRGEEGIWDEWSEWSGCDSEKEYVATRTRKCLSKDTFQPTNIDRCLLIPGNKGDLDVMPCRIFKTLQDSAQIQLSDTEIVSDDVASHRTA